MTQTAKKDASAVGETAKQSASDVANEGMQQAKAMTGMAKDHARGMVDETTSSLKSHGNEQAERAASGLDQLSSQVQALLSGRPDEAGQVRDYVQQVGDRAHELAERLRAQGVDGVVSDASRFARRRPGLFLAGAAAAGFLVGRMVKAQRSDEEPRPAADSVYPTSGFRSTPGERAPYPDATEPLGADAIPSVAAGSQYGTSHASEPERWR